MEPWGQIGPARSARQNEAINQLREGPSIDLGILLQSDQEFRASEQDHIIARGNGEAAERPIERSERFGRNAILRPERSLKFRFELRRRARHPT